MNVFVTVQLLQRRHNTLLVMAMKFVFHFSVCHVERSRDISKLLRLLSALLFLSSISSPSFSQSSSRARSISRSKYGWALPVRRFSRSDYPGTLEGGS